MQELEILQDFEETRGQLRLPPDTKPCICKLMNDYERSKSGINAFIIACELFRVGKTKEKVETVLLELAGICLPWAIKSLEKLEESGLIKFQKGKQHLWYGKASEVQRIIPIPKPNM